MLSPPQAVRDPRLQPPEAGRLSMSMITLRTLELDELANFPRRKFGVAADRPAAQVLGQLENRGASAALRAGPVCNGCAAHQTCVLIVDGRIRPVMWPTGFPSRCLHRPLANGCRYRHRQAPNARAPRRLHPVGAETTATVRKPPGHRQAPRAARLR